MPIPVDQTTLSAEVPAELHDLFVDRAHALGLARGKVLRILVEIFVEGANIELDGEVFRRARREAAREPERRVHP